MLPPSSLHPADGGRMARRNVGILPHYYRCHNPEDDLDDTASCVKYNQGFNQPGPAHPLTPLLQLLSLPFPASYWPAGTLPLTYSLPISKLFFPALFAENIQGLNLVAVRSTTFQVSKLSLHP